MYLLYYQYVLILYFLLSINMPPHYWLEGVQAEDQLCNHVYDNDKKPCHL